MSREIPKGANRARVQFYSRQLDTPIIGIDLKFPRDREELQEILDAWHNSALAKHDARFTIQEVVQTVPIKVTRQYSLDLHSILFIETHYYNDEPDQESP